MKSTIKTATFILLLSLVSFISCIKKPADPPVVTTMPVTEVSYTAAISGGDVTSEGGETVTGRGICWNTSPNPELINSWTIESGTLGIYKSVLVDLIPNTTYYVRAYANNATGTGYGGDMSFTTKEYGSVADVDGNIYKTADIDSQVWMAENLKTTKYRNGDLIGTTTPITLDISDQSTPKYQWDNYNGNETDVPTFGRLYTWFTVADSRGICPTGWHVPSDVELEKLIIFLGGDKEAVGKLKEALWSHWLASGIYGTNESGFSALPGADRDKYGNFQLNGYKSKYWTSIELNLAQSLYWYLSYKDNSVSSDYNDKSNGFSIRCVKDN